MPATHSLAEAGEPNASHFVVYQEEGRFAGWPANNGAWSFGEGNLLVGFTEGPYKLQKGHNIGDESAQKSWLARSGDGGETWQAWDPNGYVGDFGDQPALRALDRAMNFEAPGFALRLVGTAYHGATDPRGHFFFTEDRGDTWEGPFGFGDLLHHPELTKHGLGELTPRTDYVVLGKHRALIMISARIEGKFGTDRLFCALTEDGGRSFSFRGWIVPPYGEQMMDAADRVSLFADADKNPHPSEARAVMSESFLLEDGRIVTAMRRRYLDRNWVDAYLSADAGQTWTFVATIGDAGSANGNPPALNVTEDGRLCAVYGDRASGRIMVTYSADFGVTWSDPVALRDDFGSEDMETNDLGYPRLLRRPDGQMVALYYYSTDENRHGIFTTIWDPTAP